MSSSDKFPDWSLFRERSVPVETDLLSPAIETGAMLQAYHTRLEAEKQAAEEIRQQGIDALVQQALLAARFSITLDRHRQKLEEASLHKVYRSLKIVEDQMRDALQATGLEILIPQGKPFDEIASYVDVRGWRHHENFSEEIVSEVIEPIVFYQGKLVHSGTVVMGAPKEKEPDTSL
jgi:hypothetical protein